jgi:hypothetical protein
MQKAGLEAEIGRLERLRAAHFDDQHAIRRQIRNAQAIIETSTQRIGQIEEDLRIRVTTRGDAFAMEIGEKKFTDRRSAGGSLLTRIRLAERSREPGVRTVARIGGFNVKLEGRTPFGDRAIEQSIWIERTGREQEIQLDEDLSALGLISRLEYALDRFEVQLAEQRRALADAQTRLPAYEKRLGEPFAFDAELQAKLGELKGLNKDLESTNDMTKQ